MKYFKQRAWSGVMAFVCLLTGLITVFPVPAMNGQVIASTGPDLIVESISWSPESPSLRDTVTFTTTVRNQGDSQAPQSCIAYYIDDILISSVEVNVIAAGDTIINTFTWQATAGDHIIKAITDSENDIAESNEDNNVKVYAFSVIAADLIIESITWSPQTVSAGDSVNFTITVKNRGNKFAKGCWAEFFIDGASRGQREINRLEPGDSKAFAYTWVAQVGEHTLKATIDILNQSVESDEANNELTQIYSTTPPDLIISSIQWSPPDRTDTDNVTMHVTVKNNGSGAAYGSQLNFYVDDMLQGFVFVNPLSAGSTSTKTYTWMVGPDAHTFTAIIDADNQVFESNESNNTYSVMLPALGLPDLLVKSITWTPTQPTINSRMTFTITVENAGKVVANGCSVDLYIGYGYKVNRLLGTIPAEGTAIASIEYITSTVPVSIRAIVDPNNLIKESDETNNEKTASLTPVELVEADFYITNLTSTPQNPAVGDEITITAKIKNNCNFSVASSHIAYYVDGVLIYTSTVNKMSPKATVYSSITWTATPGTHTIKAVADYNDYYMETDESNNIREIVISVLSPDLAIKSITWSPVIPSPGDALTITFTIINQGTYKSGGFYLGYYVDGSYQGNHYIDEIAPGGTVTRTFPWTLINSLQTFKVIIDGDNSVLEDNESNNEKTVVIPAPDLTIESITYSPADFSENSTITFVITIKNAGASQSQSTHLDCFINNILQTNLPVVSISVGESTEVFFYWTAQAGQNTFKVAIDSADSITESDESNNDESISLQTPAPITEPEPIETPEETTDNATSDDTEQNDAGIFDADDIPPAQADEVPSNLFTDGTEDVSATSTDGAPWWQNIFMNRWIIIGVGVLGLASIAVLLILHKRAQLA